MMKKKLLLVINFILGNLIFGQGLSIKSPQSYEVERSGNIPVNLNVGGVDLSIPIFEPNFSSIANFKLTLDYNSSGFIPNKKSNYVGHNWLLNFGGIISRDVNGVADDSDSSEDTFSSKGFLIGTRLSPKMNTDIFEGNFSTSYWKDHISINGYQYELQPDKFNFNFMGISGYFYIGNNGTPIIISNDLNLQIDVSNISGQQNYGCTPSFSEVKITDGNGIKYYFGGHYNNLEISYQFGSSKDSAHFFPQGKGKFTINSWYLKKVEYPNNQILEIEYLKYQRIDSNIEMPNFGTFCISTPPPQHSTFDFPEELFDYNRYVNQINQRFKYNYDASMGGSHVWGDGSGFSYESPYFQYSLTKKVFPQRILLNGKLLVSFSYARHQSYDNNYQPLKLYNIEIRNGNETVKKINLEYYRNKDRFFLSKLSFSDNRKYSFDYYDKENLPKETTFGIDFWGYWNGKNEDSNLLIPLYHFNADTGDYQIIGTSRNSNPSLVATSLLKNIIYPTGGSSTFYYEPHSYSKKLEKDFSSNFFPYLKNESGIVGGARVAKIIDFDGTSSVTREFKYIKNYGLGTTESSGIASSILRYMYFIDFKNTGYGRTQILQETANNISENSLSNSPIRYSEVSELKNNMLQKKYYFSDFVTNPNSIIERNSLIATDDIKPYQLIKNFSIKENSNDYQRGRLLKTVLYKDNTIVQEIENSYTPINAHTLVQNRFVSRVQQISSWNHYQKEYMLPYVLNSTIKRDYSAGFPLVTAIDYNYSSPQHLNITNETTTFSDNSKLEKRYQYVEDLGTYPNPQQYIPPYRFIPYMAAKNMTGVPLVTSTFKNNIFLNKSQTLFEYNPTTSLVLPKSIITYSEDKNNLTFPNQPDLLYGLTEVTYDRYDSKGNLQQYTTKDGLPVSIVWGYNGMYPIAKVEGLSYDQIESVAENIISMSNIDASQALNNDESQLLSALDFFKGSFPFNFQITTYTYDPLIGVRSITPPSGIREYYIYDNANRLKEVKDINGKILKEYEYKYKQ